MPSATEQLIKVQDQVLETLENIEKPIIDAVKSAADKVEGYVPDVTVPESVPTLEELIAVNFAFAEKLLATQKGFAEAIVAAIKPVTGKLYAESAPKTKAKAKSAVAAA